MLITEQVLRDKGAYCEGIQEFLAEYPEGYDTDNWNLEEQFRVLRSSVLKKHLGWAWYTGLLEKFSMAGANLSGARYNMCTRWSVGFTPTSDMILVEAE